MKPPPARGRASVKESTTVLMNGQSAKTHTQIRAGPASSQGMWARSARIFLRLRRIGGGGGRSRAGGRYWRLRLPYSTASSSAWRGVMSPVMAREMSWVRVVLMSGVHSGFDRTSAVSVEVEAICASFAKPIWYSSEVRNRPKASAVARFREVDAMETPCPYSGGVPSRSETAVVSIRLGAWFARSLAKVEVAVVHSALSWMNSSVLPVSAPESTSGGIAPDWYSSEYPVRSSTFSSVANVNASPSLVIGMSGMLETTGLRPPASCTARATSNSSSMVVGREEASTPTSASPARFHQFMSVPRYHGRPKVP